METESNPLNVLLGEQLSAVIFIQDYCQLDFDGNILTCYIFPTIILNNGDEYKFPHKEYRNMLCELISTIVVSTNTESKMKIEILFSNDSKIYLQIDYTNPKTIEIAMFQDINDHWSFF